MGTKIGLLSLEKGGMGLERSRITKPYKIALWTCNLLLMILAVTASVLYARHVHAAQVEAKKNSFVASVESLKSVSQNYLNSERGYVENWAAYINGRDLTLPEALEFLREINTNPNRFPHIVDMDTMKAWSAYYPAGSEAIETYYHFAPDSNQTAWEQQQGNMMQALFEGTAAPFSVLGRYQLQECVAPGIGLGARITLKTEDGHKDYLLLRTIPAKEISQSWVFPTEYQDAEVGIITRSGDYVIQSSSMKSTSFIEYIRAYNFADDYNAAERFRQQLETGDKETFYGKNFRGKECLWYYSSFGENSDLCILGMLDKTEFAVNYSSWYIVAIICGTLLLLVMLDGIYLHQVNLNLRRTAQLAKQASEAKTQFLSAMSHDIRTPMNAVLGMMSIAQRNLNDPVYAGQCLEKASSAGKRLLTLINDVLDISKIESGQFVLTPAEVSAPELYAELIEMMKPQIQEKGVRFTSEVGEMPHPVVLADPIRLNQIYMNLFSNSVKYTSPGYSIHLKLYEELLPGQKDRVRLVFCVADTGIGMSSEFQKTMYQSFSRAISTQVNRTQGTGLGLAIVRQMVDLMGGTIDCTSAVGKGTTFTVRLDLPIADPKTNEKQENEPQNTEISGLRLLVAEDNDLNWEIMEVLLTEYGVACQRAENGRRCLETLVEAPAGSFDGILMDVQMPEMDGREATRQIRALPDEEKRKIPIVAMTADAFAEDVQACLDSGMNGHIAKPIDAATLQNYLRKIKNKTI